MRRTWLLRPNPGQGLQEGDFSMCCRRERVAQTKSTRTGFIIKGGRRAEHLAVFVGRRIPILRWLGHCQVTPHCDFSLCLLESLLFPLQILSCLRVTALTIFETQGCSEHTALEMVPVGGLFFLLIMMFLYHHAFCI